MGWDGTGWDGVSGKKGVLLAEMHDGWMDRSNGGDWGKWSGLGKTTLYRYSLWMDGILRSTVPYSSLYSSSTV